MSKDFERICRLLEKKRDQIQRQLMSCLECDHILCLPCLEKTRFDVFLGQVLKEAKPRETAKGVDHG